MERIVRAQGGDPKAVREPDRLPRAAVQHEVKARTAGYVRAIDALAIGQLSLRLGAGRTRVDAAIDPAAGVLLRKRPGDRVAVGEVLAELHAATSELTKREAPALLSCYELSRTKPRVPALVIETIRS
jgi:thymidine phosphorylase